MVSPCRCNARPVNWLHFGRIPKTISWVFFSGSVTTGYIQTTQIHIPSLYTNMISYPIAAVRDSGMICVEIPFDMVQDRGDHLYIYRGKMIGPSIDPCGTPQVTTPGEDISSSIFVTCMRPLRYDSINFLAEKRIPYDSSFDNKILWLTVLNAFFRSKKRTPQHMPWFISITI